MTNSSKDRPILFNGDMVRAILRGAKTQTRRPVRADAQEIEEVERYETYPDGSFHAICWRGENSGAIRSPFGAPGDRLYVRETFASGVPGCKHQGGYSYRADHRDPEGDGPANPMRWTPSIHMPRAAARIWLRVDRVRVERVRDLFQEDAREEGVADRDEFFALWRSIYGDDLSAWVWACAFTVLSTTGEPT